MTYKNEGQRKLIVWLADNSHRTSADTAWRCGMLDTQFCHLRKGRRIPTLAQAAELNRVARIPVLSWLVPAKA